MRRAVSLLQAIEFTGIAMVEFKGAYLLECNPRIWGSFPLTDACGSRCAERCGAVGEGCNIVQTDVAKVGNDLLPDSGFCAAADDAKVRNLVALAQNV